MPQKLIRLTSSSGDGVFNGLFNEDIIIPENSEIALQSLTLERRSDAFSLNNDNNNINFQAVGLALPDTPTNTGEIIPQGTYTNANDVTLLDSIANACNRNSSMITTPASMNIQWRVESNDQGKTEIRATPSPLFPITATARLGGPFPPMSFVVNNQGVENGIASAEPLKLEEFQAGEFGAFRETDTTTNNLNECYMYGSVPIIKSTGSFRARFKRLNATGEDSAIMGFVKGKDGLAKLNNSTLTEADFEYQIKIRGQAQAIQYKIKGGSYTNSASTPINHVVADPLNKNDVFEICLDSGDFLGIVNQNSAVGGTGTDSATPMPRLAFDVSEDYYFVLCLLEGKDNIVLDNIGVSLDPFAFSETGSMIPPRLIDTYLPTTTSALTTLIDYETPNGTELNGALDFVPPSNRNTSLANFLGFPSNKLRLDAFYTAIPPTEVPNLAGSENYDVPEGFFWTSPNVFSLASLPDNYIVDTQTFTLDSYDSYGLQSQQRSAQSGGSRRNILATIPAKMTPITGTANTLLQFEPATLNYIGIKNRGTITTRQLRFRVLSSTYDDIILENIAALTLLVRSY